MAVIIVPEPRDPTVPLLPPQRPDGQNYRFSMRFDGGRSRAYADTETDLCSVLLDGFREHPAYAALAAPEQFQQRYFYCKQVQVWLQAAINGAATVRPLLPQATEAERAILLGERAQTVQVPGGVWTSPIPLVLVSSEYAPITALPRPVSRPPADTPDPLIWLDPITEDAFLRTLHQATAISLSVSDPPAAPPQVAPAYPDDPPRGAGLRWTPGTPEQPGTVQLWAGGTRVAEAEHPIPTAWRYWHNLEMGYDFAPVTQWEWWPRVTCQVRLEVPTPPVGEYPDPAYAAGTIQFGDATQPVLSWTARGIRTAQGRFQWELDVPLPPDAAAPTLPLRIALSFHAYRWVVGDHCPRGWEEVSTVAPAALLHDLLADEQQGGWRLAGEAESVRVRWLRALGLEPDAEEPQQE